MGNYTKIPTCKHCGKDMETRRQIYCSKECYTNSGHRAAMGRVNGKLAQHPKKIKRIPW